MRVKIMQGLLDSLQNTKKMGDSLNCGRWLNAHDDRSAGLKVFSARCILLCDSCNTGDYNLIIAEPKISILHDNINNESNSTEPNSGSGVCVTGRLRVYRGAASLCSERPLHGPPSSILSFYTDDLEPRIPAVAVSIGTNILIYKNNKPFFKWSTPEIPVSALEQEIWRRLISSELNQQSLKENITALKSIPFIEISPRSQKLLILASEKHNNYYRHLEEYIGKFIHSEMPTKPSIINSMCTLNKNSKNANSIACLVIATENGLIYILDPIAFSVLHQASCTSQNLSPIYITASGQYDIEYKIIIACRDGSIWVLRRDWLEGRRLLTTTQLGPIIDCLIIGPENQILIAGNEKIGVWTKKGKLLYNITPQQKGSKITCMALITLPHLNTNLIAIGVNTQIQFYQNRTLVDIINLSESPSALKFGRLSQEDNVLVIITKDGSLIFKILKRMADFSPSAINLNDSTPNNSIVNKPLPLPKRSKLFAEQMARERSYSQNIHQIFQQDLIKLRLLASQLTVNALNLATNVSDSEKNPIKLSAQVLGLGPRFTLTLTLENLSTIKMIENLQLLLHVNTLKYKIEQPFLKIPSLPPEVSYKIEISVTEIIDSNMSQSEDNVTPIRVFVFNEKNTSQILAACINMPPTDPLAFLI